MRRVLRLLVQTSASTSEESKDTLIAIASAEKNAPVYDPAALNDPARWWFHDEDYWTTLLDRCPTSLGETWYGGTTCHGWSSTPTRDLGQHVLGVQPSTPGFTRVRVAPNLGHLDWAEANVPSPSGDIRVRVDAGALVVGRDDDQAAHRKFPREEWCRPGVEK